VKRGALSPPSAGFGETWPKPAHARATAAATPLHNVQAPNRAQQLGLYIAFTAIAFYAIARLIWP